jgi:hypothetical protein
MELLFSDNIQFWYETKRAFGEALATGFADCLRDFDSWYNAWAATVRAEHHVSQRLATVRTLAKPLRMRPIKSIRSH